VSDGVTQDQIDAWQRQHGIAPADAEDITRDDGDVSSEPAPSIAPAVEIEHDSNVAADFVLARLGTPVVSFAAINRETGDKGLFETKSFPTRDRDEVFEHFEKRQGLGNQYYSVNRVIDAQNKKASRENIAFLDSLHVDLDPRQGEDLDTERQRNITALENYDPPPTWIIASGPAGVQGIWDLVEPVEIDGNLEIAEDLKLYNIQIERDLGGDKCHNIDRILRVPGTINCPDKIKRKKKPSRPYGPAYIIKHNDVAYTLDRFNKAAPLVKPADVLQNSTQKAAPRSSGEREVPINKALVLNGPVDGFEERVSDKGKTIRAWGNDRDALNKILIDLGMLETPYASNSDMGNAYVCTLVAAGYSPEEIAGDCLDPDNHAGIHFREQKDAYRAVRRSLGAAQQIVETNEPSSVVMGMLEHIDAKHVVVRSYGGKCFVMYMQDSPLGDGRTSPCFQTPDAFKAGYAYKLVRRGKLKPAPLGEYWFFTDRPGRRQFEGVTFKPGDAKVVNDHFNLWQGFGIAPVSGDWSLMQWHILHVLCSGNQDYADYLTKWLAWTVQNPDKPAEAAVALRGLKGVGKGLLGKYFGRLFGQHYLYVSNAKHVVGNFNSHLWDCVFLFCDEAFAQNNLQHDATLKSLITETTITIEPKGLGLFQTKNYLHAMLAANADWFVPATHDERRYFVLDVSDVMRGNVEYFVKLCEQMDGYGCSAMLHDLLAMPLGKFHPRNPPKTTGLAKQIDEGMPPEAQWWEMVLRDGVLPGAWSQRPSLAYAGALYASMRHRSPALRDASDKALSKFLRLNGAVPHKATVRGWQFPPLADCRDAWAKRYPGTVWDDQATYWAEPPANEQGGTHDDIPF
jgi:hypothetical protein